MTETMIVAIFGMIAIGVFGFLGRRGPASGVAEWTVASRKFGAVTTFFLQAGEVFTTFTFLGLTGLAYATGVPAVYALGYIPLQYLILYLVAPKLWTISRDHGYVGQPDFLAGQYRSKVLGCVAAVMGFAFLLPYLQLQITGLGLIVQLATGQTGSATLSMAIGTLLVVGFVMWAGIRGVAATAYLKDILMVSCWPSRRSRSSSTTQAAWAGCSIRSPIRRRRCSACSRAAMTSSGSSPTWASA